eukprot:1157695-Pelagomonas_calceolata.AAC.5
MAHSKFPAALLLARKLRLVRTGWSAQVDDIIERTENQATPTVCCNLSCCVKACIVGRVILVLLNNCFAKMSGRAVAWLVDAENDAVYAISRNNFTDMGNRSILFPISSNDSSLAGIHYLADEFASWCATDDTCSSPAPLDIYAQADQVIFQPSQ